MISMCDVTHYNSISLKKCSSVQWVDIHMMLASVSFSHPETSNDCMHCIDIDMMLASVMFTFNDCSPIHRYEASVSQFIDYSDIQWL